jgi:hypothetical protein
MVKVRIDATITPETSHQIDRIVEEAARKAMEEDLSPSSKSEVVEMLITKGIKAYRQRNPS